MKHLNNWIIPKNKCPRFFNKSSQHQSNKSAQNKLSIKFSWIEAIMYKTWINRKAQPKNPSTRESKSSAHNILFKACPFFQHDPDNQP